MHPMEVAAWVQNYEGTDEQVAAAYLHDVLEDTPCPPMVIYHEFGHEVLQLVLALTDSGKREGENRAAYKRRLAETLGKQSRGVQTIKYADIISNTRSIAEHDPKFSLVYLPEIWYLLKNMKDGNPDLRAKAIEVWKSACNQLQITALEDPT